MPSWHETMQIWLPYESSRGCWWGARQHCTFCGLNGETMAFREKSPDRVIGGLQRLLRRYRTPLVCMIDNIIPHSYFRKVLPRFADELPPAHIFYETKANLTLEQVELLRRAGVGLIQPGIEALSSSLLRRMGKGVLARQNLALLRYARAVGLAINWNLLYAFPGDEVADYTSTIALMPLIRHLTPPTGVYPVSVDRFSPYFHRPADYGIGALRPLPGYEAVFPECTDLDSLAYHFTGEYNCAHVTDSELYDSLAGAYHQWRDCWRADSAPPMLHLTPVDETHYLLMDTRGLLGMDVLQFLDEEEARTVLIGGPIDRQPLGQWAIERKLAVDLDGWCVPLAVTEVETWRGLEGGLQDGRSFSSALPPVLTGGEVVKPRAG
jgi:ribosomal peptide maturation radical SAM protein 1